MTDRLLGRQLDEYRLVSQLGAGGMARVYLGLDVRLQRYVAIKVIETAYRTDTLYTRRFVQEAQAIARLEHPHIVRLYRFGETDDGLFYMAMQYIEGADLGAVLGRYEQQGTVLPAREAVAVTQDVAAALDYAHGKDVVHRDVKPSNIMLDHEGQAYLTDFGLALLASETPGEAFGTPHYIAPEQAAATGRAVPASDLYALGVIVYRMFTGRLPFDGDNAVTVALQHVAEPPPPPRLWRPELSPALEEVILKALAKAPDDRFASGMALAQALAAALPPEPREQTGTLVAAPASLQDQVSYTQTMPPLPVAVAMPEEALADADPPTLLPDAAVSRPDAPAEMRQRRRPYLVGCVAFFLTLLLLWGGVWWLRQVVAGGQTLTPPPTLAPAPTSATPEATRTRDRPTPTATPTPGRSQLLIATNGKDSLFVMNTSSQPAELSPLRLSDGRGALEGSEWDLDLLLPGACVTVWNDRGRPDPPNLECKIVGEQLFRDARDVFWDKPFTIYYDEQRLGTCSPERCQFALP